jgi:hypothetical protein
VTGVPRELATAPDFIMVRAALVEALGGANEALVWHRVDFRCSETGKPFRDASGEPWWPASYGEIAESTGLSSDQVKRALVKLEAGGFLESTEHRRGGNYDRTKSYRPVFTSRPLEQAESPDGVGDSADRSRRIRPQEQALSPDVPLYENTEEREEHSTVAFDEFWRIYPRREGKQAARKAFSKAVTAKGASVAVVMAGAQRYATDPNLPSESQYIPYPQKWLNEGRWQDDPLPPRLGRGQQKLQESIDLVGRYREMEQGNAEIGDGAAAGLGAGRGWEDTHGGLGGGMA